jgi:hypothetical protein
MPHNRLHENVTMTPSAILHELTFATTLPKGALLAASRRRAEMVPLFLETIKNYTTPSATTRCQPTPLLFIFFLLAEWRETSAYRPLARLLRSPELFLIIDDAFDMILHRAIAAVFDGDPEPLYDMLLDPAVNQIACAKLLETVPMLVWSGEIQKDSAAAFLAKAFATYEPADEDFQLETCARIIGMLGFQNLKLLVRKAIALDHLPEYSLEEFEEDLAHAQAHPGQPRDDYNDYTPVTDAIEELSTWPCFSTNS